MPDFENLHGLHELCRLRSTLESFAAVRLRANTSRKAVLAELNQRLHEMKHWAAEGSYDKFHETDMRFHRTLVESCNMSSLLQSWDIVTEDLAKWILHVKENYWPSLMTLYREHLFLVDAWQSEEDWIAEQATHHHLEAGWFRIASAKEKVTHDIDPVDRATSFICTHFVSNIEVDWLAQNVSFVSSSHLTRLFRQRLGISPHAYLRQVRLERAAQMLKTTSDPVATIAKKAGYKNTSHFIRDFHKTYFLTPKQYRSPK